MKKTSLNNLILGLLLSVSLIAASSCSNDDNNGSGANPIVGSWLSAGTNVAPLLDAIFTAYSGVDSIYATFTETDYAVRQVCGNSVVVNYSGTYTALKDDATGIYTLTIAQTLPSATSNAGIYKVYDASPDSMKYEVVLVNGTNTPPTPATGFGSTNGGAFGTTNIQRYIRLSN
jgi:hypothetical protein